MPPLTTPITSLGPVDPTPPVAPSSSSRPFPSHSHASPTPTRKRPLNLVSSSSDEDDNTIPMAKKPFYPKGSSNPAVSKVQSTSVVSSSPQATEDVEDTLTTPSQGGISPTPAFTSVATPKRATKTPKKPKPTASTSAGSPSIAKTPAKKPGAAQRKKDWEKWCNYNQWELDVMFTHVPGHEIISRTEAKRYYRLTLKASSIEIDTLPYTLFYHKTPSGAQIEGRSYDHEEVKKLAYRKAALLNGEEEPKVGDEQGWERFLEKGKELFDAATEAVNARAGAKDRAEGPKVQIARADMEHVGVWAEI